MSLPHHNRSFATKIILPLCLLTLVGCSSLAPLFPAPPPITPTVHVPQVSNGLIAFTVRDLSSEKASIYTINPDGTNKQRLLDDETYNADPYFASDGRLFFYLSSELDCYQLMSITTRERECIPFQIEDLGLGNQLHILGPFLWSPDGTKIAFQANASAYSSVYMMNMDGSDLRQISPAGFFVQPSWSPDSKSLAFADSWTWDGHLHVINVDCSGYLELEQSGIDVRQSSWAQDGQRIFFQATNPMSVNNGKIYVIDRDGSNLQAVSTPKGIISEILQGVSPDGKKLLMLTLMSQGVYVMVLDADNYSVLSLFPRNIDYSKQVIWSPDSQKILYQTFDDIYYVSNIDGSEEYQLDIPNQYGSSVSWQPVWK